MPEETLDQQTQSNLPPVKLAFIIENEVADILHTDDRLGAIFTSNPLILNVTERFASEPMGVGYTYNPETDTFSEPIRENIE
jgi:hypothetical protein